MFRNFKRWGEIPIGNREEINTRLKRKKWYFLAIKNKGDEERVKSDVEASMLKLLED